MKPLGNWYKVAHRILQEKTRVSVLTGKPEGLEWLTDIDQLPKPWMQWIAPGSYRHQRAKISIANLPDALVGVRILHLADLHFTKHWGKAHDQLLSRLNEDPPNLILFTGDFVEDRCDHRVGLVNVLKFFSRCKTSDGIYAILGNHDPDVMTPYLLEAGIGLMTESCQTIATEKGPIELIGFPGHARLDMEPGFLASIPKKQSNTPRVLLSHYPDLLGAALKLKPDLYLCGHTHGGQICLPGEKPILTHDSLPRTFAKGLHRIDNTWVNISSGFGFTGVPLRVFCPSEVTEFVLAK